MSFFPHIGKSPLALAESITVPLMFVRICNGSYNSAVVLLLAINTALDPNTEINEDGYFKLDYSTIESKLSIPKNIAEKCFALLKVKTLLQSNGDKIRINFDSLEKNIASAYTERVSNLRTLQQEPEPEPIKKNGSKSDNVLLFEDDKPIKPPAPFTVIRNSVFKSLDIFPELASGRNNLYSRVGRVASQLMKLHSDKDTETLKDAIIHWRYWWNHKRDRKGEKLSLPTPEGFLNTWGQYITWIENENGNNLPTKEYGE